MLCRNLSCRVTNTTFPKSHFQSRRGSCSLLAIPINSTASGGLCFFDVLCLTHRLDCLIVVCRHEFRRELKYIESDCHHQRMSYLHSLIFALIRSSRVHAGGRGFCRIATKSSSLCVFVFLAFVFFLLKIVPLHISWHSYFVIARPTF
jgi:hypothetical protein